LGAVLAIRSGEGSDFYAPGIVINAISLLVLLVSLLARRPLVGLFIGLLDPRVQDWATDPDARRVYGRATWVFIALYASKLAVQVPLLLTGRVAALGVAKLAMGLPAFAVIAYLVWLMHRALLARRGPAPPARPDGSGRMVDAPHHRPAAGGQQTAGSNGGPTQGVGRGAARPGEARKHRDESGRRPAGPRSRSRERPPSPDTHRRPSGRRWHLRLAP